MNGHEGQYYFSRFEQYELVHMYYDDGTVAKKVSLKDTSCCVDQEQFGVRFDPICHKIWVYSKVSSIHIPSCMRIERAVDLGTMYIVFCITIFVVPTMNGCPPEL